MNELTCSQGSYQEYKLEKKTKSFKIPIPLKHIKIRKSRLSSLNPDPAVFESTKKLVKQIYIEIKIILELSSNYSFNAPIVYDGNPSQQT